MVEGTRRIGYAAIAACMSSDADLSIYRRFGELNSCNLLYLQSELMELETSLHELDARANDVARGSDAWSVPRSWYFLQKEGGEHLNAVLKLRERLKEYS